MIEEALLEQIKTFGFPIVMCLLLYFQGATVIKKNTEAIQELVVELRARNK